MMIHHAKHKISLPLSAFLITFLFLISNSASATDDVTAIHKIHSSHDGIRHAIVSIENDAGRIFHYLVN